MLVVQLAFLGAPWESQVRAASQPSPGSALQTPPWASVDAPPAAALRSDTVTTAVDQESYKLDSGDKIRVHIYQREDLSGEFLVDTRGTITLPVLGAFKAAGKDEGQLGGEISRAAQKALVRSFDVVVDVSERRPIYIVGFVEKPGVYPFALRMTVVHGLSMAGGPYRPKEPTGRGTVISAALNRIQSDTDARKLVIVRLTRLEAEPDERPFTDAPRDLMQLTGEVEARDLTTREQRLQASEAEVRMQTLDTNMRARDNARQELEDLRLKIAQIDIQLKLNQTQKIALKTLVLKGFVRTTQVASIDASNANFTINRLEVLANVSRATRTLDDLTAEVKAKDLSRRRDLLAEIAALTHQGEALKASLRTARNAIDLTKGLDPFQAVSSGQAPLLYSIMRRTPKGFVTFAADDVTPLLPGDVLRVGVKQLENDRRIVIGSN
jgi:protein involved in polysaccharide export with SLBB domain